MLGLRCCMVFSLYVESRGYSLVAVCGLLIMVASLVERGIQVHGLRSLQHRGSVVSAPRLQRTGSVAVAHGLSCSLACGIFLDQGSNLCLLHWQADSLPPSHHISVLICHISSAWCHMWHRTMELASSNLYWLVSWYGFIGFCLFFFFPRVLGPALFLCSWWLGSFWGEVWWTRCPCLGEIL